MGRGSFELQLRAVPQSLDFACALSSAKVGIRFAVPWGVVVVKVLAIIVIMAAMRVATCVECCVLVMLVVADSY